MLTFTRQYNLPVLSQGALSVAQNGAAESMLRPTEDSVCQATCAANNVFSKNVEFLHAGGWLTQLHCHELCNRLRVKELHDVNAKSYTAVNRTPMLSGG